MGIWEELAMPWPERLIGFWTDDGKFKTTGPAGFTVMEDCPDRLRLFTLYTPGAKTRVVFPLREISPYVPGTAGFVG